jgi:hypothetical protein
MLAGKTMPHAKARSPRERREADLLLNVVLAHMAFHSAKDPIARKMERERFTEAARKLHEFVAEAADEENSASG